MRSGIAMFFAVAVSTTLIAAVFLIAPVVLAKGIQADEQCPPGGQVGQKCTDTTNGYTTNGHCTHIHVCKADSWNTSSPSGCGSSGNIFAPTGDCPRAPQIPQGGASGASPAKQPVQPSIGNTGTIDSSAIDRAFSTMAEDEHFPTDSVSTTSLNGIEYFIADGEALASGEPLTEETPELIPPPRTTLVIGSVYDLRPQRPQAVGTDVAYGQSYAQPVGGFAQKPVEISQVNFASQAIFAGSQVFGGIREGVRSVLLQASGLNPQTISQVVVIGPYKSMYDQVSDRNTAPFVEPPWQKVSEEPLDYKFPERLRELGGLFIDAVAQIGAGSYDLFTANLTQSKNEFSDAFSKTGQALGLVGNLTASVALLAIFGA